MANYSYKTFLLWPNP